MSDVQATPERVIARLRPHGRALFWPTLALIAIALATGYYYGRFPQGWQNIGVLVGAALLTILLWLIPLFSWLGRNYTVTTRRVILRSGFLVRVRQELLHSRGYDVTVRQNGLQTLFRSGNVLVNTGLDHPVVLKDVPRADLVQAALHDLMESNVNPVATHRQQEASRGDDDTVIWGTR
jgi:membrane protein YdbS with pleckstrin-like domain